MKRVEGHGVCSMSLKKNQVHPDSEL
jgi:hypothetical protein